jgi:hypothetical protein
MIVFLIRAIRFPRKYALQLSLEGESVESGTQKVPVSTTLKATRLHISDLHSIGMETDLHERLLEKISRSIKLFFQLQTGLRRAAQEKRGTRLSNRFPFCAQKPM